MSDIPRYLVTTSDNRAFRTDLPILLLGEWCRWHGGHSDMDDCDILVAEPYGLKKGKKDQDISYIDELYESLLLEVGEWLNRYHGTSYSNRYWRIVVGTWLYRFTTIVYNRWATIQQAVKKYDISGTTIINIPQEQIVPQDYLDFARLNRVGDWDHAMYSHVIKTCTDIPYETVDTTMQERGGGPQFTASRTATSGARRIVRGIVDLTSKVFSFALRRSRSALIISTCMPRKYEYGLHLLLGQLPLPRLSPPTPNIDPDFSIRNQQRVSSKGKHGFEKFIRDLIPHQIPTCYLEGFLGLQKLVDELPWPTKPRFIFTANSFDGDEVFKSWTASKVEEGIPYIISQHGANYGNGYYAPSEHHEVATADRYLTWGWQDHNEKHFPSVALAVLGRTLGQIDSDGGLLLVERGGGHRVYPWDEMPLFKSYMESQFKFVERLPEYIQKQLTVRLYSAHLYLDWSEGKLWKSRCPRITLDAGIEPIEEMITKHRLTIYTYNSTGFLELLALNIPTMVFWDTNSWPIRESAKPHFELLKKVGVFHEGPETVAAKVFEIWESVDDWWQGEDVQQARRSFCDVYARMPERPLSVIAKALTGASYFPLQQ